MSLLNIAGWIFILVGIILWISGIWYGPGLFFSGLVIEGVGYFFASNQKKQINNETKS